MAEPIWHDPNNFDHPDLEPEDATIWCVWPKCQLKRWRDLAICRVHAELASQRAQEEPPTQEMIDAVYSRFSQRPPLTRSVVYYVLVKPGVVKIGYTSSFYSRMSALRCLRSDLLALEVGGREKEQERHRQFESDRIVRLREDFQLSPALQQHIDSLAPQRTVLLKTVMPKWFSPDSSG